jgi:mannosyltransferase OCH1-like enzyme
MTNPPIPRLLHQSWKTTELSGNFEFWRRSFFENNPALESRFYVDDENRELVASHFPGLLPLYDSFEKEIFRADFVRPVYMFLYGGVYADLDFQCIRPLDQLFGKFSGVVVGRMGTRLEFTHSIPNALMMSSERQGFWIACLINIEAAWNDRASLEVVDPEYITGPVVLRQTVLEYQSDNKGLKQKVGNFLRQRNIGISFESLRWGPVDVLPGHVLYPLDWTDRLHQMFRKRVLSEKLLLTTEDARKLFPHSLAVTYWTHSW